MARTNINNGLHWWFYFSVILMGSISSIKTEIITARTLEEFRTAGWVITGSTPTTYVKPGSWKAALRPLDAAVSGGSVWRVTSSADTIFRFDKFASELCAKSITVEVTLFMENTVVSLYPWKNPAGSEYFYPRQPTGIQWVTETIDVRPGSVIEFKMNVIPGSGGYIFFDQITISHDGVECDTTTTTEESTTTDTTRTTEDSSGWTEETPIEETVEPGTTNTDEETSSTTQITTEEPSTTTPEEGIPEEPETGGTATTNIPTQPSTTDEPTDNTETSSTDTTEVTEYIPTDSTSQDPTSSSTDDTTGTTGTSTTVSDITDTTDSSTTVSDTTQSTEGSTTEGDTTETTDGSTTVSDTTGSTVFTTEGDTTESTMGSTTDNDESSESSPITPSLPPTSDTTSSSTESTSETTLSTNPSSNTPTEGITPPPPASTSTTKIPVIVLPGTEKRGLTVQQILLYIVLPTAVGITAFLGTVFYFGFKGYKWWGFGSKDSKEQLIREGVERASNRGQKGAGGGGGSKYPPQISPTQQTSVPPPQVRNVSLYPSAHHQQANPAFLQSTPVQNSTTHLPRQSPSAFHSQLPNRNGPRIPPPTSRPNVGKSVTLNIPNQEEIYYGTSEHGSFSRPPIRYTGEYTGGELPRIRRKMD